MATFTSGPPRANRRARTLRFRAGVAQTFGPLFFVLALLLILPGTIFLYDALTHPLTADSGQVMIGSICLAVSVLLLFFLGRESF
ncbi:MAG TPA: hypothetical protein VIW23_10335 [Candidatus Acidoferrum sp.]|jgi:hypothetical protein